MDSKRVEGDNDDGLGTSGIGSMKMPGHKSLLVYHVEGILGDA
jgi:hypothetical protein